MIRKKIAILVPAFLCAALFFSLPALCFAQAMNGTYTVKTSGGDYASIQAAAVDLSAFGVSGPVVIEVYGNPITYSGLVTINAIAGSSAVNTVTFREFAGEDVTVSNSSGNNIFYLNDPDYVTIDGFTIQNCTQDGIRITNTSKSVTIKNCTISNAGTSGNYSAIYADVDSDGVVVQNNTISGDYYGIRIAGTSTAGIDGNIISGNTISGFGNRCIYMTYTGVTDVISNNNISANANVYGIYLSSCSGDTTIENNTIAITGATSYSPIYITNGLDTYNIRGNNIRIATTSSGRALYVSGGATVNAVNNMFTCNGNTAAVEFNPVTNVNFYYNAVYNDYSGGSMCVRDVTTTSGVSIYQDNIFYKANGGTALYVDKKTLTSNYNDYYLPNGGTYGNQIDLSQSGTTLSGWQTVSGKDANSMAVNPVFTDTASGNLHVSADSGCNGRGTPVVGYTTDYDNGARDGANPDIGADEVAGNAAMSGTYGFSDVSTAVSALTGRGVSGPVVINVSAGTTNGGVWIGAISGVSAVNTVTIQGANSIISNGTNGIELQGAGYIILKGLTIRSQADCGIKSINSSNITIANNMLDTTSGYGIKIDNGANFKVYYNSLYAGNTASLYAANTDQLDYRNNIFYNTSANSGNSCINLNTVTNLTADYNCIYAPNESVLGIYDAVPYDTLSNWRTALGNKETNSLSVDPLYMGFAPEMANLHIFGTSLCRNAGSAIAGVTDDYDGQARPEGASADIGADETSNTIVYKVDDNLTEYPTADFTTANGIQNAIDYLVANNVAGSVRIEVYSGTYNGITVPSNMPSMPLEIAEFAGQTAIINQAAAANLVVINGADYVTIDGFTIQNCTQDGIKITNTAIGTTIKNCSIASVGTSSSYAGIYVDGNSDSATITGNTITSDYYGINYQGASAVRLDNCVISNNTINITGQYDIRMEYCNAVNINYNTINTPAGSYHIYLNECDAEKYIDHNIIVATSGEGLHMDNCDNAGYITNNKIKTNTYAIYQSSGGASYISNNMLVCDGSAHTVYLYYISTVNFYYNSVYNNSTSTQYCVYDYNSTLRACDYRGNIFYKGNGGTAVYLYYENLTSSNNAFYLPGGGYLTEWYNASSVWVRGTSLSEWQTNSGKDANSIYVNPLFTNISTGDLHVSADSGCNNRGVPIGGYTKDYDGATRDGTNPDIGADEFTGNAVMSGTYGFADVSTAVSALIGRGINGPVVLNVNAGASSGNVLINSQIAGISAVNTVTIQGINSVINGGLNGMEIRDVSYITIKGLVIRNQTASSGCGIKVYNSSYITIANNLMDTNGQYGMKTDNSSNINVYYNSIYGSNAASLYAANTDLLNYRDNIFYNFSSNAADNCVNLNNVTNLTANYNCLYAPNAGQTGSKDAVQYADLAGWRTALVNQELNSIEADPQYFSLLAGGINLHIINTSPCRNAGANIAGIANDCDNQARPEGAGEDIGADETKDVIVYKIDDNLTEYPAADFTTAAGIQNAIDYLVSNSVYGRVRLEVYSGTYTGITIPSNMPSAPLEIVEFAGQTAIISQAAAANLAVINGADYVTIDGFTIQNCTQDGVKITNTAFSAVIKNCTIASVGTGGNYSGIYVDGNSDSALITGNTLTSDYYGINCQGANTVRLDNSVVSNNTVNIAGPYMDIRLEYCNTTDINYNTLNSTGASYHIYMNECDAVNLIDHNVCVSSGTGEALHMDNCDNNNYVTNNKFKTNTYAIYQSGGTSYISNNMLACDGNQHTVDFWYTAGVNFYYNSVYNSSTSTQYCVYDYNSSTARSCDYRGNIFYKENGGTALYLYYENLTSSNNAFYLPGGGYYAEWYNASSVWIRGSSLSEWQTNSGKDANSIYVNPLFTNISTGDLHVSADSGCNNRGTPIGGYTLDYDGVTRDGTNPDIGADEFTGNAVMSGTYAFADIGTAVSALTGRGVNGPVVINVGAGAVNGGVLINSIAGVSAVNTVTIQGANSVINGSLTGIEIRDISYITVKGFTIRNQTGTTGCGIKVINSNYITIANNLLDTNNQYGIRIDNSANINVYYNSLYAGNTASLYANTVNLLDYRDNIFYNASAGAGTYCVYLNGVTNITADYNCLYAPAVNCLLGYKDAVTYDTMAAWRAAFAPAQEANSFNADPLYRGLISGAIDLHLSNSSSCRNAGISISGMTSDYDGQARPEGIREDIGADEVNNPVVYRIDDNLAEYPTADFTTANGMQSAIDYLVTNGIYGGVRLEVYSGTYTGITIPSNMPSMPLEIVEVSGQNAIISQAAAANLVVINGADYVTVNGFTIQNCTQDGVKITNISKGAVVKNCSINTVGTGSNYSAILVNTDSDGVTIQDNTIVGDYYGIYINGTSTSGIDGNIISGNTISGFGNRCIYMTYTGVTDVISNNNISANANVYGIYLSSCSGDTTIENNTIAITGATSYSPIYITSGLDTYNIRRNNIRIATTSSGRALYVSGGATVNAVNNMFTCNGNTAAVEFNPVTNVNFYYNAVYNDYSGGSMCVRDVTTTSGVSIYQDNIFYKANGGTALYVDRKTLTSNYNDFYLPNGGTYGNWYDLSVPAWKSGTSLALWQTASGKDANSINVDPQFVNTATGDLHISETSPCINQGTNIPGYTTDKDNQTRSSPDIGADEIVVISKIVFTTLAQTLTAGTPFLMTVETRNVSDIVTPVSANTTILLSSTSITSSFAAESNPNDWSVTSVTISAGTASVNFYFRDTTVGSPQITCAENPSAGWTDAIQTETITLGPPSVIAFLTSAQPVVDGIPSLVMTIQTRDLGQNVAPVSANTVISLSSNSAGGSFSATGSFPWVSVNTVTLPAGQSTVSFYYRDITAPGVPTVTCSANLDGGFASVQQVQDIRGAKLVFTTLAQTINDGAVSDIYTVQIQDAVDSTPVSYPYSNTISLSSSSSGGAFSNSSAWPFNAVSSITISAGSNSASFYYRDTESGAPTITCSENPEQGWTDATQEESVLSVKLVFTTSSQTMADGVVSGIMTVQMQNSLSMPVSYPYNNTINLFSSSSGGAFSNSSAWPFNAVSSITISAGSNSASFYYRDTESGAPTITCSENPEQGWTDAVQTEFILAVKIVFTSLPQVLTAGKPSNIFSVQILDSNDAPAIYSYDNSIQLTTTNPITGRFDDDTSFSVPITEAVVYAGGYSANFYYRDTMAGNVTITAAKTSEGWSDSAQNAAINPGPIALMEFISVSQTLIAGGPSTAYSIRTSDLYGNPSDVPIDITVKLVSTSLTGRFGLTGAGPWTADGVTISANTNTASFYYTDTLAGAPIIICTEWPDLSWSDASQTQSIIAGPMAKVSFTSAEQTVIAGESSAVMTAQITDSYGNVSNASQDVEVTLSSTSSAGAFGLTPAGPWDTASIVVYTGANNTSFYYRDTLAGAYTLAMNEISGLNWEDDTQNITVKSAVISQLVFITDSQTLTAGTASDLITIQARDQYENPGVLESDTSIEVLTTSASGGFSASGEGPWNVTLVMLPANSSSASFYYYDTLAGTASITVRENPELSWTDASQDEIVLPAPISKIVYITAPQNTGEYLASGMIVIQAQDEFSNPSNTAEDVVINLAGTSSTGRFGLADAAPYDSTFVVMAAYANTVSFYYYDEEIGTYQIAASEAPSRNWADASQGVSVYPWIISRVAIIAYGQQIAAGSVSSAITLQTQHKKGFALPVSEDVAIAVSTNSANGGFSASIEGPFNASAVTMPAGNSLVNVYYSDIRAGQYTLAFAEEPERGWIDDSQSISVVPGPVAKLSFVTQEQVIGVGTVTDGMTVMLQDAYDNESSLTSNTMLTLASSSIGGKFSTNADGPWMVNVFVMQANTSRAAFYYTDTVFGVQTVTVYETPDKGWADAQQGVNVVPGVVTVSEGERNPMSTTESRSAKDLVMMQFNLRTSAVAIKLDSIIITGSGYGNEALDVDENGVVLCVDSDGDGKIGENEPELVRGSYAVDNGNMEFSGLAYVLPASSETSFVVMYNLNGSAFDGSTFLTEIGTKYGINGTDLDTNQPIVVTGEFPVQGAIKVISSVGTLTVLNNSNVNLKKAVSGNQSNVSMLSMNLEASSVEDLDIEKIIVHSGGTGNEKSAILPGGVKMIKDANKNGVYDYGEKGVGLYNYHYSEDNGAITFNAPLETIPAGENTDWVLVYNFSGDAKAGDTFRAAVDTNVDVIVRGKNSGKILQVSGVPLTGDEAVIGEADIAGGEGASGGGNGGGGGCFITKAVGSNANYGYIMFGIVVFMFLFAIWLCFCYFYRTDVFSMQINTYEPEKTFQDIQGQMQAFDRGRQNS